MKYLLLILFLYLSPLYSDNVISKEKAVANYLYNFIKYTYWPQTNDQTFDIHLISNNSELEKELGSLYRKNFKENKKIKITRSKYIPSGAEVVFVDSKMLHMVRKLYTKVEEKPVLIVTEGYQNLKLVMINLIHTNEAKLKFQINKANILNQGLRTDPKLTLLGGTEIDVAKLYKKTKDTLQEKKKALEKINKAFEKREKELHDTKKNLDEQNKKLILVQEHLSKLQKSLKEIQKERERDIGKIRVEKTALQKEMNEKERDIEKITEEQIVLLKEMDEKETILDKLSKQIKKEQKELELLEQNIIQKEGTIKEQKTYILILSLFTAVFLSLVGVIIYLLRRTKKTNIELKNTQEQLQQLNNTLADEVQNEIEKNERHQLFMLQQRRLVQMGEMISMIAHQWRQPLNILAMLNQTIVSKYNQKVLDDKAIDYFKKSSNVQIKQMSQTIDDFRNFFKPEKEKVEFYIDEVITDTINMIKPILSNDKIDIRLNINDEIKIIGYPNELGQAVLNMINNAKDALLEKNIKEKIISISLAHVNERPTLTISDNAGGIPDNIMDKIFNPYFSTKEKNGTGLGLYMTKMIIEEHMNARLDVTNNSQGAVFRVIFED